MDAAPFQPAGRSDHRTGQQVLIANRGEIAVQACARRRDAHRERRGSQAEPD
jgi:hypothetical protein